MMPIFLALMIVAGVPTPAISPDGRLPDRLVYNEQAGLGIFGTYKNHYLQRRWRKMCKGPARYDAMREASQHGRPNPCR